MMAGDAYRVAVEWNHTDEGKVRVKQILSARQKAQKKTNQSEMLLMLNKEDKLVILKSGKEGVLLEREQISKEKKSSRRYPIFVRLEKAWLTPSDELILQVNGMRKKVTIAQLEKGAKESAYGKPAIELNILKWDTFKAKDDFEIPAGSEEVSFGKKKVNPGYSLDGEKLGFGHRKLVVLEEGLDEQIFELTGSEMYHSEKSKFSGEAVQGWSLMRREKFKHDRDWVSFYLLKSEDNIHAKPSN
jgi:hypothetical protein